MRQLVEVQGAIAAAVGDPINLRAASEAAANGALAIVHADRAAVIWNDELGPEEIAVTRDHRLAGTQSSLSEAIHDGTRVGGTISVESAVPKAFGEAESQVLRVIAGFLGSAAAIGSQARTFDALVAQHGVALSALSERAEELTKANVDLEQFAFIAAHDLQEPLRAVTGYIKLLARRYHNRLDSEALRHLTYAADGSARMQQLISGLLDHARVGQTPARLAPLAIETVLQAALANLAPAIEESHAQITWDPMPQVIGNREQLIVLFQNLLSNAIKFRGADAPQIHVGAEPLSNGWSLFVRDNGIGISPRDAEQIFGLFQRLHSRSTYPGNGIGLAIAKKIVERHGGRLRLVSEPGEGAAFIFTLPAAIE